MINSWNSLLLLAQEVAENGAGDAAGNGAGNEAPPAPGLGGILIWVVPIMVVWFVMFVLPQNKERAARQEMLKSLKKNDPVVTIGGILGTVSHISEDGKEVTLKIDDNTRVKMQREAIREVFRRDSDDTT